MDSAHRLLLKCLLLGFLVHRTQAKLCNVTRQVSRFEKVPIIRQEQKTVKEPCPYDASLSCFKRRMVNVTDYENKIVNKNVTELGCCPGYKAAKKRCFPICEHGCFGGRCTAPNTCTCNKGFEIESELASHRCVPKCTNCTNGNCVAPDTCYCRSKFTKNEAGICVPECSRACINGLCIAPDVCQCEAGFRFVHDSWHKCESICETPCQDDDPHCGNGCQCDDGFARSDPGDPALRCEPQCALDCINGTCVAPDTCECLPGHERQDLMQDGIKIGDICLPHCDQECNNGDCMGGNECQCLAGYQVYDNPFECEPVCEQGCVNGDCIAPSRCKCWPGFGSQLGNASSCEPVCDSPCENGFCSAPQQCACREGFRLILGKCEPVCESCTDRQHCVSPGVCQCLDLYVDDGKGECLDCPNGDVVNGQCECHEGYTLEEPNMCIELVVVTINQATTAPIEEEAENPVTTAHSMIAITIPATELIAPPSTDRPCPFGFVRDDAGTCLEDPQFTDMELVTTARANTCDMGELINGVCVCPDELFLDEDNNCNRIDCAEECLNGTCSKYGLCECGPEFMKSPHNPNLCVEMTMCDKCFQRDAGPCAFECNSRPLESVNRSIIAKYLIIAVACLITVAIVVVLAVSIYRRMQKHDYYMSANLNNESPIYAFDVHYHDRD